MGSQMYQEAQDRHTFPDEQIPSGLLPLGGMRRQREVVERHQRKQDLFGVHTIFEHNKTIPSLGSPAKYNSHSTCPRNKHHILLYQSIVQDCKQAYLKQSCQLARFWPDPQWPRLGQTWIVKLQSKIGLDVGFRTWVRAHVHLPKNCLSLISAGNFI